MALSYYENYDNEDSALNNMRNWQQQNKYSIFYQISYQNMIIIFKFENVLYLLASKLKVTFLCVFMFIYCYYLLSYYKS